MRVSCRVGSTRTRTWLCRGAVLVRTGSLRHVGSLLRSATVAADDWSVRYGTAGSPNVQDRSSRMARRVIRCGVPRGMPLGAGQAIRRSISRFGSLCGRLFFGAGPARLRGRYARRLPVWLPSTEYAVVSVVGLPCLPGPVRSAISGEGSSRVRAGHGRTFGPPSRDRGPLGDCGLGFLFGADLSPDAVCRSVQHSTSVVGR